MSDISDHSKADSNKLAGLFKFASGILSARGKTRLRVDSEKLGCFREQELIGIPGLTVRSSSRELTNDAWLCLERLRQGKPPLPEQHEELFLWLDQDTVKTPEATPQLLGIRVLETTLLEAKKFLDEGILKLEGIAFLEPESDKEIEVTGELVAQKVNFEGNLINNSEYDRESVAPDSSKSENLINDGDSVLDRPDETIVRVTLLIDDSPEVKNRFGKWMTETWSPWVKIELPVRRSISLYKKLFKLHTVLHSGDSSANEIVWGVGTAEYGKKGSSKRLDIPLVEFLIDIDLQDSGTITLTPRDVPPYLNLRPLMEAGLDGAENAQPALQQRFQQIRDSDDFELTPFTTDQLDEYFTLVAGQISSDADYVNREVVDATFTQSGIPERDPERLRIHAGWVIYGRPRSTNYRVEDLGALRQRLDALDDTQLPESLCGFVQPLPEHDTDPFDPIVAAEYPADWGDFVKQKNSLNSTRYYFPLASNDDQNQIITQLEQYPVVTVTGPPGTGKTHSIANILAHYMASGKRVLVTARTPEAISAVQEKLPEELASLIISSVASDREGARQMESAIQRLSDEVVNLNEQQLQSEILAANDAIEKVEDGILECETNLARISQSNLTPLTWQSKEITVMDLSVELELLADSFGWFTDRPENGPTELVTEALNRIATVLNEHRAYVGYAFASVPTPEELPSTKELIDYQKGQRELAAQPVEDLSNEPPMAVDTPEALLVASDLESYFSRAADRLGKCEPWHFSLCREIMTELVVGTASPTSQTITQLISKTGGLTPPSVVIDYKSVERDELHEELQKRLKGDGKSFFAKLFKNKVSDVLDEAKVNGKQPESATDWQNVIDWIELDRAAPEIRKVWQTHASNGSLPAIPASTHELAIEINRIKVLQDKAIQGLPKLVAKIEDFESLFPHGINARQHFARLEFDRLGRAIRANLKRDKSVSSLEATLTELSGRGSQPFFLKCKTLLELIHSENTDTNTVMAVRNELTRELEHIRSVQPHLDQLAVDLSLLAQHGVPEFAETIRASCLVELPVNQIEPDPINWQENWPAAWEWATATRQLNQVLKLGNGDDWRKRKAKLVEERQKRFLSLIQSKTRAGLKRRITPEISSEFRRFTLAIGKLGAGTGKAAYRHRKEIKAAARKASSAVPVWIMPESKVSEQLPADLGIFDLVILDEASQSDITSLGVLSRGTKLLIVGDEKQVSPSAVGVTIERVDQLRAEFLQEVPNRNSYDEKTSIFDIAMLRYPQSHVMLREHFRCVHPIIEFSTRFYEGRLIPLRVPKSSERFDPPLVDVRIEGSTRIGKINEAEANYIVEEIATITSDTAHRDRDIAVISLIGGEQAEHIERLLMDDARIGPEVIERHHIVCGDSRTMQGQERSVVFLSMVADESNAKTQQSQADRQRFNVAMSRARDREYLIRSVASSDLKINDLKNEVIQHFYDPLPDGREMVGKDVLSRCESGFESDVCKRLLDAGYRVRSQVAAGYYRIDLVVEGDNDTRLAIELDGDYWHSPDKWDSDMSRQVALERAGWHFWRVFGSQWYSNKEYYWDSLLDALKNQGIESIGGEAIEGNFTEHRILDINELNGLNAPEPRNDEDASLEADEHIDATAVGEQSTIDAENAKPYELETDIATLGDNSAEITSNTAPIDPTQFYEPDYQATLAELSLSIIDEQGPINFDHLAMLVARQHGFSKTGRKIHIAIESALAGRCQTTKHASAPDVMWPNAIEPTKIFKFRGRTLAGIERQWSRIPWPERVGLAKLAMLQNPTDPVSEIMDALAISRAGKALRAEFDQALDEAVDKQDYA